MKKYFSNIVILASLLTAGAAMTACSDDQTLEEQNEVKTYQVTVSAAKAGDAQTRALSFSGTSLNATWTAGDVIYAYNASTHKAFSGSLVAQTSGSATTNFSGNLSYSGTIKPTDQILLFNKSAITYTGQVGTLFGTSGTSISEKYDNFLGKGKATVTGSSIYIDDCSSADPVTFDAQQAIVKFTLVKSDGMTPLNATSLTVHTDDLGSNILVQSYDNITNAQTLGDITITPASATNEIYAALAFDFVGLGSPSYTVTLTAVEEGTGTTYSCMQTGVFLGRNNYYEITAKLNPPSSTKALSAATVEDVGKLVGQDGNIYLDTDAASAAGTTAVAKIIYVGSSTGDATYNHGLALALTDESQSNWDDAVTACSGKNTSLAVSNASWMLPSQDQWNTMVSAAGTYDTLRDGFGSITGASNMSNDTYWSSSGGSSYKYAINFNVGTWNTPSKTLNYIKVRACLAF